MKRYFRLISTFVSLSLLAACQEAQPDGSQYAVAPELAVSTSTVQFTNEGGVYTVTVDTEDEVIAASEKPWVEVAVSENKVTLSVGKNTDLSSRYSSITVVAGRYSSRIQVVQTGFNSDYLWAEGYEFHYSGGSVDLKYTEIGTVKLNVEGSEWISTELNATEKILKIVVSENPYKAAREGAVTFTVADETRVVVISQEGNPKGKTPGEDDPDDPDPDDPDPDDPDPDDPTEIGFESFIGNWTSGANTFIVEDSGTQDVLVFYWSGFFGGEQPVPVFYNAETKKMEFYYYDFGADSDGDEVVFGAVDADNYVEFGGEDMDIMLASASLSSDGKSLSIEGNAFTSVYNGTPWDIQIVALNFFSVTEEGDIYSWNTNTELALPVTFTKSSTGGSSVMSSSTGLAPKVKQSAAQLTRKKFKTK